MRTQRVVRALRLVFPVLVGVSAAWYDAVAAHELPDAVQIVAFACGTLSLWLVARAPVVPTLVAPLVWALTGSCTFVTVMSAVLAASRPRWWWTVLAGYSVLHPLGLVPDPCVFRAGHVVLPEETAPLVAVVLPALVGGAVGETWRLVAAREERLRLAAEVAAARAADVVTTERLRLSRDLHDLVGQGISRMTLHASALATQTTVPEHRALAGRVADIGAQLLDDVHFVVGLLRDDGRPARRRPLDWAGALAVAGEDGLDVRRLGPAAGDLPRTAGLDDRCAAALGAVLAEALNNVAKHAPAATVSVSAEVLPGRVCLSVVNTRGTEHGAVSGIDAIRSGGHGLAVAAERASEVGGLLRHAVTSDGGFRVDLEVPR